MDFVVKMKYEANIMFRIESTVYMIHLFKEYDVVDIKSSVKNTVSIVTVTI